MDETAVIRQDRMAWPLRIRAVAYGPQGARLLRILISAAVFSNARYFLRSTSGVLSFVLAGLIVVTCILMLKDAGEFVASASGLGRRLPALGHLALAAGAVMATFVLVEAGLQVAAWFQDPSDRTGRLTALTMPAEWERRPAHIQGARYAYYWQGILHVHNTDHMRHVGPFPPKAPGTFRILAVGDSLTYGYGVAAEDAYPSLLDAALKRDFRAEVLNLGVSRAQSEDVYKILRKQVPLLQPDLVLYGVCLNDFLPTGVDQYASNRAYQVPLPDKDHFVHRTRTGKLLERQYDILLMRWGLRDDFLGDILKDFEGYRTRFARDVRAMNAFVGERGLPPMIAMVLDQYPSTQGKRYEVVLTAERLLRDAGMRLIESDYIRRNDGRTDWYVSRWEGHPNERAHRAFAEEILPVLKALPELQPYRRDGAAGREAG